MDSASPNRLKLDCSFGRATQRIDMWKRTQRTLGVTAFRSPQPVRR
jgi:hypothetical protein